MNTNTETQTTETKQAKQAKAKQANPEKQLAKLTPQEEKARSFTGMVPARHAKLAAALIQAGNPLVIEHASRLADALQVKDAGLRLASVIEATKLGHAAVKAVVPDIELSSDKKTKSKQLTALRKARADAGANELAKLTGMATELAAGDPTSDKWRVNERADGGMNAVHTRKWTVKRTASARWSLG